MGRSRWAAIGAARAVTLGGGGFFVANASSRAPSSVVTIDPVRVAFDGTNIWVTQSGSNTVSKIIPF